MSERGRQAVASRAEARSEAAARDKLLRLAREAAALEYEVDAVLDGIRENRETSVLAPQARAIAERYIQLRYQLPWAEQPRLRHCEEVLDLLFDHRTHLLHIALAFHVVRQARHPEEELDPGGLGPTSAWLPAIIDALESDRLEHLDSLPSFGGRRSLPF
jgi:hypothetical protein